LGDITDNFSYYEFRPKGKPKTWKPGSEYRKLLLKNLATNLQVVRSKMPKGSWMVVTSGVRMGSDYSRLKKAGYNPSKTSDHYAGAAIPLHPSHYKYKKFGETYNFAVGAADIVPRNMSVWDLFAMAVRLNKEGLCDFGQIIYEKTPNKNPRKVKEWVHFGGSLDGLFTDKVIRLISRTKYMKTTNGGKNYSVVR